MFRKLCAITFCFFMAGSMAFVVNHAPVDYVERQAYVLAMTLCVVSGLMTHWLGDFISSE